MSKIIFTENELLELTKQYTTDKTIDECHELIAFFRKKQKQFEITFSNYTIQDIFFKMVQFGMLKLSLAIRLSEVALNPETEYEINK